MPPWDPEPGSPSPWLLDSDIIRSEMPDRPMKRLQEPKVGERDVQCDALYFGHEDTTAYYPSITTAGEQTSIKWGWIKPWGGWVPTWSWWRETKVLLRTAQEQLDVSRANAERIQADLRKRIIERCKLTCSKGHCTPSLGKCRLFAPTPLEIIELDKPPRTIKPPGAIEPPALAGMQHAWTRYRLRYKYYCICWD